MNQKQTNFENFLQQDFPGVLQNLKDLNLVYEDVIDWTKEDWKDFAGIGVGNTIFNFLHPSPAAPAVEGKNKTFSLIIELKRSRSDDDFIKSNNLDLKKPKDLIKFTIEKNLKKNGTLGARFKDNCLELRLDQRRTKYWFDSEDDIKVVLAPSGAGKTRMILELLYNTFGYYFTVKSSQGDFGSRDLQSCMIKCGNDHTNVRFYLSMLYFVRATVCNHLISLGFDKPWQILLAQLHPNEFFGSDVFDDLFKAIVNECRFHSTVPSIEECFPFVAIDEIQTAVEDVTHHSFPGSRSFRPFLSPLVYYSKQFNKFPQFMVAGTGINFEIIKQLLESSTMKYGQTTSYQVLSNYFRPLTKDQATDYARFVLQEHKVVDVESIVKRISDFDLCHGRARFVAFIVDGYLKSKDIDQAFAAFIEGISNVNSHMFPLRFLKRDIDRNGPGLNRIVGNDTLSSIIRNGILDFIISGKARLHMKEQDAADTIQYGLGFGEVSWNAIVNVRLEELAIVECLRYLIPFDTIVKLLAERISSCPKAQMAGYLVEYLVAFALVANTSGIEIARRMKFSQTHIAHYLRLNEPSQVCFPDHMCGPDVIYKCLENKTVYVVQIKFVKGLTKQERVNACNTTDPAYFYCNRKTKEVLKGYEDKKSATRVTKGNRSLILDELVQLQNEGFTIKQLVFIHTGIQVPEIEGAQVVTSASDPNFFDCIGANVWGLLDSVRKGFE
jgi:hypothetical protein